MATPTPSSNSNPAPSISRQTPTTPAFNHTATPAQLFYGARGRSGSIASSFAKQQAAIKESSSPPLPPIPASISLSQALSNSTSTPHAHERGHGHSSSVSSIPRSTTLPSLTSPVRTPFTGSPIRSTFGDQLPPIRAGESFSFFRPTSPSKSSVAPTQRTPSPLGGPSLALPPSTRGQNRSQGDTNTYSGGSTYSHHSVSNGNTSGHAHARSSSTVAEQIPLARLPSKQSREALIPIGKNGGTGSGSSGAKNGMGGERGGGSPSFGAMFFGAGKRASLGFGGREKDKYKDREEEEKHVIIPVTAEPAPSNSQTDKDKEKGWGDSVGGVHSPRESIVRFTRARSRSSVSFDSQTQGRSSGGESNQRGANPGQDHHQDNKPREQPHRTSPHVLIDEPRQSNVTDHPVRSSYPRLSESSRRRPTSFPAYSSSGWQPDMGPIVRDAKGRVIRQHELIASESRWFCQGRFVTGGGTRRVPVKERRAHPYAADKFGEDGDGGWAYSVGASGYAYEGGGLSATTNTHTTHTEAKLDGETKRTKRARLALIPYPFVFSMLLVLGTAGAWISTTCVWWWKHVSPGLAGAGAWLVLLVVVSMARTAFTDPGIVPRNLDPSPAVEDDGTPYARDLNVRGISVRVKYCLTCKTYRPLRSSHCRICDNCVDGCDHHCQWVNNCIGRRNYSTFITFLIACFLAILLMAVTAALHIYFQTLPEHGSKSFREALGGAGVGSAVVFVVCAVVVWPVGTLLGYHIRLLALNITTIEQLRNSAHASLGADGGPGPNAFSLGKWTRNAAWGACRPAGLSWVEGWQPVRADQRRLLEEDEVAV